MKISNLTSKNFLNGTNAMAQSTVVVNYKDNSMETPITYATSLEILGKSIANHLSLLGYNSGAVQTYTTDNETYGVTTVDINDKADKVSNVTEGNFAGLDINGNLTDSGHKHSDYLVTNLKGADSGLAELDANGKIPITQLPLGNTSSTVYRGDYGNTAYTHATDSNRLTSEQTTGLYKIATTAEGHIASVTAATESDIMALHTSHTEKTSGLYKITVDTKGHVSAATAVEKSDITALGIPAQDTTYSNATQSTAGLMSAEDKTKLDGISLSGSMSQMPMSPGTDGVYLLRATITNGEAVYDWVSAPNGSGVSF